MPLVNGETAVAHAYMSDALQARRQTGGKIEYIIPEEGATLWIDNLVIPNGAQNTQAAHALINFLMEPQIAVQTTLAVLVAPTNKDAYALLPEDLRNNPVLFPNGSYRTEARDARRSRGGARSMGSRLDGSQGKGRVGIYKRRNFKLLILMPSLMNRRSNSVTSGILKLVRTRIVGMKITRLLPRFPRVFLIVLRIWPARRASNQNIRRGPS